MHYAIEAEGLAKTFGKVRAVDGIDLKVAAGSVYAVLGPNGAGKTTAVRMLATLIRPDAGTARIFGHDVVRQAEAVRDRISLTGQFASIDDDLTGRENLTLLGRLLGFSGREARARAEQLLEVFGLKDAAGRQVKKFSGGMRRRIDIAASIIVAPDLLFLDEPTTGLDPRSRNQVWDIVRLLVSGGTTVMLTTQYLEEADQLADRIAVIDHGKVIAEGTSSELKARVGTGALRIALGDASQRLAAQAILEAVLHVPVEPEADDLALAARVSDGAAVARALGALANSGIAVTDFSFGRPTLDEVFLTLTGRPTEELPAQGEAA